MILSASAIVGGAKAVTRASVERLTSLQSPGMSIQNLVLYAFGTRQRDAD